jgi:hypothetical protein
MTLQTSSAPAASPIPLAMILIEFVTRSMLSSFFLLIFSSKNYQPVKEMELEMPESKKI